MELNKHDTEKVTIFISRKIYIVYARICKHKYCKKETNDLTGLKPVKYLF